MLIMTKVIVIHLVWQATINVHTSLRIYKEKEEKEKDDVDGLPSIYANGTILTAKGARARHIYILLRRCDDVEEQMSYFFFYVMLIWFYVVSS